ncbi:putative cell wall-binding protein [Catenulispora sp. GAS73]|uniref:cell wall-binding repeat-containing protein n=1 Tax=Catenulispora sp. GAS73 TaxID=3156269 RepID=UPI003513CE0D
MEASYEGQASSVGIVLPIPYCSIQDEGFVSMNQRRYITLSALSTLGAASGLLAAPAHAAAGSTIYVDKTVAGCIDTGPSAGTAATPFCTPSTAIASATPGSTVLVQATNAGTGYDYSLPSIQVSGISGSPVTVRFATGARVEDLSTGLSITGQHDVVVDGLAMQGALTVSQSQGITITNAYIHQGAFGISLQGVSNSFINTVRVSDAADGIVLGGGTNNVTVAHASIDQGQGNGVVLDGTGTTANTIRDSEAVYNIGAGIVFRNGARGDLVSNDIVAENNQGVLVDGAAGNIVDESTIAQNCAGVAVQNASTGTSLTNNIVSDNGSPNAWGGGCKTTPGSVAAVAVDASSTSGTRTDYNVVHTGTTGPLYTWGSTTTTALKDFQSASAQGSHDTVADPKFVTSGGSPDFQLAAGSPAIDTGDDSAAGNEPEDYAGHSRTVDAVVDRGALEFQQPTPTPTPTPVPTPAPTPGTQPVVSRVFGGDRYGTSVAVSQRQWATAGSAKGVVLATGRTFPDALSGVPLAAHIHGPLLLTDTAAIDAPTLAEISRVLGPDKTKTVYILGGTNAVSREVENAIVHLGYHIQRFAGTDRYDTSRQVAASFGPTSHVVVATGANFPDALSAGPLAAAENAPVILSADATLDRAAASFVASHSAVEAVGGQARQAVQALNIVTKPVEYLYGLTRYETSARVAAAVAAASGHRPAGIGIASGTNYPDALTGGAFAANADEALLLTDPQTLQPPTAADLQTDASTLSGVTVFGGPAAVSDGVVSAIAKLVNGHVKS